VVGVTRVVAIVGRASVGKTTIRRELAERLHWPSMAIDEHRQLGGDWTTFVLRVHQAGSPVLCESVVLPAVYITALSAHDSRLLEVTCDERARLERGGRAIDRTYRYFWPVLRRMDATSDVDYDDLADWCVEGLVLAR
jgi:hypothetical protein